MFGDLGKMMKMYGEVKRKLPEMQAKLASSVFTADAGGGAVRAGVSGKGQLVELKIDPAVLKDADAAMVEDLVKAAVSAAQTKAVEASAEMMKELTGGMNLPGMEGMFG